MQCVQFQSLSKKELYWEKPILTIDKLHPLLEKKCAHGILENIQHGSQVLLVSSLTVLVFYYSLHLDARIPPQTAFQYSD